MRFAQSAHAILRFRVSALVATELGRPCYRVATQPCRSRRKALQTCSHSSQLLSRKTRAHSRAFAAVRTCVLQSGRQDLNLRPPAVLAGVQPAFYGGDPSPSRSLRVTPEADPPGARSKGT